jgi:hypothetical protein
MMVIYYHDWKWRKYYATSFWHMNFMHMKPNESVWMIPRLNPWDTKSNPYEQ